MKIARLYIRTVLDINQSTDSYSPVRGTFSSTSKFSTRSGTSSSSSAAVMPDGLAFLLKAAELAFCKSLSGIRSRGKVSQRMVLIDQITFPNGNTTRWIRLRK